MMKYSKTYEHLNEVLEKLTKYPEFQKLYKNSFLSTIETTTKLLEDGTTYMFTGDIPAMWLRDSSVQVQHYIKLLNKDPDIKRLINGLIKRQFKYISIDPYANSFNEIPDETLGHTNDLPKKSPWVWERKFELDSLCYPVWILKKYIDETKDNTILDNTVLDGLKIIVETIENEMNHNEKSSYWFMRVGQENYSPLNNGKGLLTNDSTNLVWSAFRPSDDANLYNFFVPGNQFVVIALRIIGEIYPDEIVRNKSLLLSKAIDDAIHKYCIVEHPKYGKIYCYETDGFGHYNLMDDANIPSLLAIPYIGYSSIDDEIYQNTRKFVLSSDNPYFYKGKVAEGIGSPHTPDNYIWHLSLIVQGITAKTKEEKKKIINTLLETNANTYYMHESFLSDNPNEYTRPWFGWANSLFVYFIDKNLHIIDDLLK